VRHYSLSHPHGRSRRNAMACQFGLMLFSLIIFPLLASACMNSRGDDRFYPGRGSDAA
jgi:hypothetical protein